jgi:hypothetical protein
MTGAATRRRSRIIGITTAVALGVGMVALAPGAAADDHILSPGEEASSNMELLVNIPKNGAFEPQGAFSSDLAFKDDYAFAGNYNGFTVYDISDPENTTQALQVLCPGSQNDISVWGDLLVLSVDSTRSDDSCSSVGLNTTQAAATGSGYWEGIRVWDISDPLAPEYVAAVETDCGSHTHTLVPGEDGETVYAYVSSYNPTTALADCQPPHDKISVVEIPVEDPAAAAVIETPVLFPDGGFPGDPADPNRRATSGCHDITAYPAIDRAAGACMGQGVIMDISDPAEPKVLESVEDPNFAFWHSATFSNDAKTVMFTDELGGGGAATCNPEIGDVRGANAYYSLKKDALTLRGYYKLPREQASTENCVAHNGSLIPVKGRDIMVQAWYQGGISVTDFSNPSRPRELAWFDRGPLSAESLILGGSWSAYYYEGYVYSNDIQQGLDVLKIDDRTLRSADLAEFPTDYNPQTQPRL